MKKPKIPHVEKHRLNAQQRARKLNFAKYRTMGAARSLENLSDLEVLPIEVKESLAYAHEHLMDALFQWPRHLKKGD